MSNYAAPVRDIEFVMNELLAFDEHYQTLFAEEALEADVRKAIMAEAARFAEGVLAPLNSVGDQHGCALKDGKVTTPPGFSDAYQQYVEGGWPSLSMPASYGGQALPKSLDIMVGDLFGQANHAWAMYPGLTAGCRGALMAHATPDILDVYLPKLVAGEWTGTMCLTEPQCGSDLGILRTAAMPQADGSYAITGTKIFISAGDHDLADNIIHLVLARLPDAPKGTRGISLFLVPKKLPAAGQLADNSVSCGSLEHKMGIHGNATCVMNFDGAKGFLIGKANEGLRCMFTFMNSARLGVAFEGLSHCERAYQGALSYARTREAGRSVTGAKFPERPADPLLVHADIRRMLLTIKSFTEGGRAFLYYLAQLVDKDLSGVAHEGSEAGSLLAFFTPIAKGFITEISVECASLGMQVYGGHGYIREWGMEQNLRDARITTMYEGTTGIQALDLLGRKILASKGAALDEVIGLISKDQEGFSTEFATPLMATLEEWKAVSNKLALMAVQDADEVGAAAVDHLMYSGYVMLAWMWAKMGSQALAANAESTDAFQAEKLATARFYFARILPRSSMHLQLMTAGSGSLMDIPFSDFS
jgi:alkylation response protein AidB-like acyl-CoA dehydrogenase